MGSRIKLDIGEGKDNTPKLDNVRIKDREMIPEYLINSTKTTETHQDAEGNIMGYSSTIVKSHTILLRPEEFYKNIENGNDKEVG